MALQPTVTSPDHDHWQDVKSRFVAATASDGCRLEWVGQPVEAIEGGRP
jgi:hypothetical protein